MKLFHEKVDKLRKSSFASQMFGQKTGVKWSWHKDEGEAVEITGPDQEAIDAMALTFRMIQQDNDAISLRNMATKVLLQFEGKSEAVGRFLDARDKINTFLDSEPTGKMKLIKDVTITHRWIVEHVLYGELAHTNTAKRETLARLRQIHPFISAMIDNEFNATVASMLDALFYCQLQTRTIYEDLTGTELPIAFPDEAK